jgi:hypothetical protein
MSTKLSSFTLGGGGGMSRRLRRRLLRACLPLLSWGLVFACATVARAEPSISPGLWTASPLRSDWNIGDWGTACGPRPSGGNEAGGSVTIAIQGNELTLNGLGRSFATTQCWEQYPGLTRVSHSSGPTSWRTVCKTSAADARQASVITNLSGSGSRLSFDETGQYQFVIKGQNCTASVRRTRTFTRVDPAAAAPAASAAEKPKSARCERVGLPERLEVRPSRKLMRPGESFTFRANVVDRAGCSVGVAPIFRLQAKNPHVELTSTGKISVAEAAPESEVHLQASVGDRALAVVVEIVSRERYDALLEQGTFNAEGESAEAAVARIASSSMGSRSGVTTDNSRAQRIRLVALIGALALAFGVLGLVLSRRSRRRADPPSSRSPESLALRKSAPAPTQHGKVCPTCRDEYPIQAEFCATDGNRLIPLGPETAFGPPGGVCPICGQGYDPGVSACPKHQEALVPAALAGEGQRVASGRKICPVCGAQFGADSQFCGQCGAVLVPIN